MDNNYYHPVNSILTCIIIINSCMTQFIQFWTFNILSKELRRKTSTPGKLYTIGASSWRHLFRYAIPGRVGRTEIVTYKTLTSFGVKIFRYCPHIFANIRTKVPLRLKLFKFTLFKSVKKNCWHLFVVAQNRIGSRNELVVLLTYSVSSVGCW